MREMTVMEPGKRRNKRGRLSTDPVSSRWLQKKKMLCGPNRSDTSGKTNARGRENFMTLYSNQQGSGIRKSHKSYERGKRTIRRRPERRNGDYRNYLAEGIADTIRPKIEQEESELFRDMDEDWAGEMPSSRTIAMNTEADVGGDDDDDDDDSGGHSIEAINDDSDENAKTLKLDQSNWVLDWNGKVNEASEDEEDDGNRIERGDMAEYQDDAEMSESCEDDGVLNNNAGKDFGREWEDSEDYSSDS